MLLLANFQQWLYLHSGSAGRGFWYNWPSGQGGDLAYIGGIVGVGAGVWHAWNCHENGCKRVGHYVTVEENGHHFRRCKKHHTVRHTTNDSI